MVSRPPALPTRPCLKLLVGPGSLELRIRGVNSSEFTQVNITSVPASCMPYAINGPSSLASNKEQGSGPTRTYGALPVSYDSPKTPSPLPKALTLF